jgi:hypothetical protein
MLFKSAEFRGERKPEKRQRNLSSRRSTNIAALVNDRRRETQVTKRDAARQFPIRYTRIHLWAPIGSGVFHGALVLIVDRGQNQKPRHANHPSESIKPHQSLISLPCSLYPSKKRGVAVIQTQIYMQARIPGR